MLGGHAVGRFLRHRRCSLHGADNRARRPHSCRKRKRTALTGGGNRCRFRLDAMAAVFSGMGRDEGACESGSLRDPGRRREDPHLNHMLE